MTGVRCDAPMDITDQGVWAAQVAVIRAAVRGVTPEPVDGVFCGDAYGDELADWFDAAPVRMRRGGEHRHGGPSRSRRTVDGARPGHPGRPDRPGGGGRSRVDRDHNGGPGARRPVPRPRWSLGADQVGAGVRPRVHRAQVGGRSDPPVDLAGLEPRGLRCRRRRTGPAGGPRRPHRLAAAGLRHRRVRHPAVGTPLSRPRRAAGSALVGDCRSGRSICSPTTRVCRGRTTACGRATWTSGPR